MEHSEHGYDLPEYRTWSPTPHDIKGLNCEDQQDWRVLPVCVTRDSQPWEESNFEAAQKILDEEEAEYEVHRFSHWGPGWFKIILVRPDDKSMETAGKIVCSLENYPVLDDTDLSEREMEDQNRAWSDWGADDYVRKQVEPWSELSYEAQDLLKEYFVDLGPWGMEDKKLLAYVEQGSDGPSFSPPIGATLNRSDTAKLLREARRWKQSAR